MHYLVCVLATENHTLNSTLDKCTVCEASVWVSASGREHMAQSAADDPAVPVCLPCATKDAYGVGDDDELPDFGIAPGALDELRDSGYAETASWLGSLTPEQRATVLRKIGTPEAQEGSW